MAEGAGGDGIIDLYVVAYPRLVGLLTSIGGSKPDAEEVAQDAFVQLLRRWDQVQSYQDPEAWVRTVAVRRLLGRLRRRRVAAAGLARLIALHRAESPPDTDAVDLAMAIDRLPTGQRAAAVLYYVADLSVREVARVLDVPEGTVKSRLSQARANLAPLLSPAQESRHHV